MSEFFNTPIVVEPTPGTGYATENLGPIWNEVRHALEALADGGEPKVIDLMSMPFGPGELDRLLAMLGRGEIDARLSALGETLVYETRFPGVWVSDHYETGGGRIALQIEVTECPTLLRTPRDDIAESAARMASETAMPTRPA